MADNASQFAQQDDIPAQRAQGLVAAALAQALEEELPPEDVEKIQAVARNIASEALDDDEAPSQPQTDTSPAKEALDADDMSNLIDDFAQPQEPAPTFPESEPKESNSPGTTKNRTSVARSSGSRQPGGPAAPTSETPAPPANKNNTSLPLTLPQSSAAPGAGTPDGQASEQNQAPETQTEPSPDAARLTEQKRAAVKNRMKNEKSGQSRQAEKLSKEIKSAQFRTYPLALILAGLKDLADAFITPESAGIGATILTVISVAFVGIPLWLTIRLQITGKGERSGRLIVQRFIQMFAVELIPGVNILPTQILFVRWLKRHMDRDREKKQAELKKIKRDVRGVRTIEEQLDQIRDSAK